MDRLIILAITCVSLLGCQSPYSPFGPQSTRVPPPPTGSIGNGNYDSPNYPQAPYPSGPSNGYPQSAYPPANSPSYSPNNSTPYGQRYTPAPSSRSPINPLPPSVGRFNPTTSSVRPSRTRLASHGYLESTQQQNGRANMVARSATDLEGDFGRAVQINSLTHNDQLQWTEPVEEAEVADSRSAPDFSARPTIVRGNNLPASDVTSPVQPSHYIPVEEE